MSSFEEKFDLAIHALKQSREAKTATLERFLAEIEFAKQFSELFPDQKEDWEKLILNAIEHVTQSLSSKSIDVEKLIGRAEEILEPMARRQRSTQFTAAAMPTSI